jgi:hypothetical protein
MERGTCNKRRKEEMNLEGNWVNSATYGSRSHYPWIHHPPFFSLFPYYDDCFPSVSSVFITTTILHVAFQFSFFYKKKPPPLPCRRKWMEKCVQVPPVLFRCYWSFVCACLCAQRPVERERNGPPFFLSIFGVSVNPSAQDNKYLPPGGLR